MAITLLSCSLVEITTALVPSKVKAFIPDSSKQYTLCVFFFRMGVGIIHCYVHCITSITSIGDFRCPLNTRPGLYPNRFRALLSSLTPTCSPPPVIVAGWISGVVTR